MRCWAAASPRATACCWPGRRGREVGPRHPVHRRGPAPRRAGDRRHLRGTPRSTRSGPPSFGIDFETPQQDGKLKIIYLRPLDLSVDETMHEIVDAVQEIGAKRLVIDSLAGFEMALAPGFRTDFRESLYRMIGALTRRRHDRQHRRGRGELHLDGPEPLLHLVPDRRHHPAALRVDRRPAPQDADGRQDAPQRAQHRHARVRDHLQGRGHRRAAAGLPRPDQRHPRTVVGHVGAERSGSAHGNVQDREKKTRPGARKSQKRGKKRR